MTKRHEYDVETKWTGNRGTGTSGYRAYGRQHELMQGNAPLIPGTADPSFGGDPTRWNPEQLLVASLSQCHMLWYLHLAASAGVIVTEYEDNAHGIMVEESNGAGQFESVILRPRVSIINESDSQLAHELHSNVPEVCFISRSVNFPVHHEPEIIVAPSER